MNCFGRKLQSKGAPSHCTVELLNGSEVKLCIKDDDNGLVLLQKVWDHLNLFEKDYFSLRFLNTSNKTSFWLDCQKNVQKQLKRHGIKEKHPKFYFGVKFYAVDPCKLREEITRYQFFQQLRRDVAAGRIPLTFTLLADLSALVAQSEFGDYDATTHREGYLHSLKLTTDHLSDELQTAITDIHRDKLRGVLPSECELQYLNLMKKQDVYGVEFYNARGAGNAEYKVGASPHGIVIHRGKHQVGLYHWSRIDVINFKTKELILRVKDKHSKQITTHSFMCSSTRVCKQVWKSCIEHHSFFRLSNNKQSQDSSEKSKLFTMGSKYRYSGRTEKEMESIGCRIEEPMVHRPASRRSSIDRSHVGGKETNSVGGQNRLWPENKLNNTEHGMFTAANWSPGSVRSLKMKFQPKNTEMSSDIRKQNAEELASRPELNGADRNSIKSTHSEWHKPRDQSERRHQLASQSKKISMYAEQQAMQFSVNRIVRGYIPYAGSHFSSGDRRRHSDRASKPREYENIVYNDQGFPVILATHKGERADEKMPFYQQDWLHGNAPAAKKSSKVSSIFSRTAERASFSGDRSRASYQITDPLMYSILIGPEEEQSTEPNLGFYEEKLLNRDSGTDSPTCNNYEDQNIFSLMQTLGKEHEQLTRGDYSNTSNSVWSDTQSQRSSSKRAQYMDRAGTNNTQWSKGATNIPTHNSAVRVTEI